MSIRIACVLLAILGFSVGRLNAEILEYYVGTENRPTFVGGTYNGLPNPNHNRLTFLFAHPAANPSSNHYHRLGAYTLTGPAPGTVAFTNFNIPEGTVPPIPRLDLITQGSGIYGGTIRSAYKPEIEYSRFEIRPTFNLTEQPGYAPGTPEHFMFNSSAGRYTGSLADTQINLQLVSKSAGLNIGTPTSTISGLANPGDSITLGNGNTGWSFEPVFWAIDTGIIGTEYSATFKLVPGGLNPNGLLESGEFTYNFTAVPEPGTYGIVAIGILVGISLLRRHNALQKSVGSVAA